MLPDALAFSKIIDHTFLLTEKEGVSTTDQKKHIEKLCTEAHRFHAYSVCVREAQVRHAKKLLKDLGSNVLVCSVLGFPDGDAFTTTQKLDLLHSAVENGAREIDMVLRVQDLKRKAFENVYQDVYEISRALLETSSELVLKVIFEMGSLSGPEKLKACDLVGEAFQKSFETARLVGPRFWKTSTGFYPQGAPQGATLEDVQLLSKEALRRERSYGIKPAGGISNLQQAQDFWEACGGPKTVRNHIDPLRFRIGSSSLLMKLNSENSEASPNSY